jgi:coenzyme F420-reducing hydrogenase delta subunit
MPAFEPQIVAFCCSHCAYSAADLAGSLRVQYPASIKIIEVPCSGRVDVLHLLRTFENGIDGAMVAG